MDGNKSISRIALLFLFVVPLFFACDKVAKTLDVNTISVEYGLENHPLLGSSFLLRNHTKEKQTNCEVDYEIIMKNGVVDKRHFDVGNLDIDEKWRRKFENPPDGKFEKLKIVYSCDQGRSKGELREEDMKSAEELREEEQREAGMKSAEELNEENVPDEISKKIGGIGVMLERRQYETEEKIVITRVRNGGPADKSGLQKGDIIKEVSEESIKGWTLSRITDRIKGKMGTFVTLTIQRDSSIHQIAIKRELMSVF